MSYNPSSDDDNVARHFFNLSKNTSTHRSFETPRFQIQSLSSNMTFDAPSNGTNNIIPPTANNTSLSATALNIKLANPLQALSHTELADMGEAYARSHGLDDMVDEFRKGAILAKSANEFEKVTDINATDMNILREELIHKWKQPKSLYWLVVMCSMAAIVLGMDESVVSGAQIFFTRQFGLDDDTSKKNQWLIGLVNAAPYMACFSVGCWLTEPINKKLGRRGAIFVACMIAALACLAQAFCPSWQWLFACRFVLGLGIGPLSGTVPLYASECAPPRIRGALVMMWQMWTAFGIMLGFVADVAFFHVKSDKIVGLNWRMMLAAAVVAPLIVCTQVFFCPESPRWYMARGKHAEAYKSLAVLRKSKLQAARDTFYMHTLLETECRLTAKKSTWTRLQDLATVPRNRRALLGAQIVIAMQQFCGVNVIAYYAAVIFKESGFSEQAALFTSMGFGLINFLFAIPAVYTIDTFGRRNLLLTTFPLMSVCLFFTGACFTITDEKLRVGLIATGIYLFGVFYSPGEGPVPFVYAAEAYPLYVRDLGMSVSTATTWFFNFMLSITWPSMLKAIGPFGAFSYYGAWNIVGCFLILFFVPETKGKTLEELDRVFSVKTRDQAKYGLEQLNYLFIGRFRKSASKPILKLDDGEEIDDNNFRKVSSATSGV